MVQDQLIDYLDKGEVRLQEGTKHNTAIICSICDIITSSSIDTFLKFKVWLFFYNKKK